MRPQLDPEIKELIIRMKKENRLWVPKTIRGELPKIGVKAVVKAKESMYQEPRSAVLCTNSSAFYFNNLDKLWPTPKKDQKPGVSG